MARQFLSHPKIKQAAKIVQQVQSRSRPQGLKSRAELQPEMDRLMGEKQRQYDIINNSERWLQERSEELNINYYFRRDNGEIIYGGISNHGWDDSILREITTGAIGNLRQEAIQRFNAGKAAWDGSWDLYNQIRDLQASLREAEEIETLLESTDNLVDERRMRPGTALPDITSGGILGLRRRTMDVADFREKRARRMGGFGIIKNAVKRSNGPRVKAQLLRFGRSNPQHKSKITKYINYITKL